jgi:hypothetical protein
MWASVKVIVVVVVVVVIIIIIIIIIASVQTGSGAHPAYQLGTGCSYPGLRRPGRETDHSPPSSAEVKNALSCTFTPPIHLHRVVLC